MITILNEPCIELPGVWSWDAEIPFEDIIAYLTSSENNKSKNLKLMNIASYLYQYNDAYGLNPTQKARVQKLYANKQPIQLQADLDSGLKHIKVFINDEYFVEEAMLRVYGSKYKLRYYNEKTHRGLGRKLTKSELQEPDFITDSGTRIEAKMCWEKANSKFPDSTANLDYSIDPANFNEDLFLMAFNKLPQKNALHTASFCMCLVKKSATFGYVVGVTCPNGTGIYAKLLGELNVDFINVNDKFV